MKIEVCINRLEDLVAVQSFNVDRIELCVELGCGGLTPSYGFVEKALELSRLPIHVLVRPRSGHFVYSKEEFDCILRDCLQFQSMGVAGIVTGVLDNEMNLPLQLLRDLRDKLANITLVFHRAFDEVNAPKRALMQLMNIGFDGILTSGQHTNALAGIETLTDWQTQLNEQMFILPGGGINMNNCNLFKTSTFDWIHLSAKKEAISAIESKFNHPNYVLDKKVLQDIIEVLKVS